MQPLDDGDLSKLLSEWRVPRAPDSLGTRLLGRTTGNWWRWLVQGRIQVPVPLAAAALVALLVWAVVGSDRRSTSESQPGVGLSGFQLVEHLNPRIIRGEHEDD